MTRFYLVPVTLIDVINCQQWSIVNRLSPSSLQLDSEQRLTRLLARTDRYATGDKAIVAIKIDRNVEAVNSPGPPASGSHRRPWKRRDRKEAATFCEIYFTIPRRPLIGLHGASRRQRRCARRSQGKLVRFRYGNKKDTREILPTRRRNQRRRETKSGQPNKNPVLTDFFPARKTRY